MNKNKVLPWLQPRGEVRWLKHAKTLINEVEPVSFLRLAWSLAGTKQSLYPTYTEQSEGGQTHTCRTYTEQREGGQTHRTCTEQREGGQTHITYAEQREGGQTQRTYTEQRKKGETRTTYMYRTEGGRTDT
jgi:hypothetical protein